MEKYDLTPAEQRFVRTMVDAFKLIAEVEGIDSAADFVVAGTMRSDEIMTDAADHGFLFDNGIDPASL